MVNKEKLPNFFRWLMFKPDYWGICIGWTILVESIDKTPSTPSDILSLFLANLFFTGLVYIVVYLNVRNTYKKLGHLK